MAIARIITLGSLSIHFPNSPQAAQVGLPVSLTTFQSITGADVTVHPTQMQQPAIPADITDDVIDALNVQLAYLGLVVSRQAGGDA